MRCDPSAVKIDLPWAISHRPLDVRRPFVDPADVVRRRVSDVLSGFVDSWCPPASQDAREDGDGLRALGAYLMDLTGLSDRAFDSAVVDALAVVWRRCSLALDRALNSDDARHGDWADDARRAMARIHRALGEPGALAIEDLAGAGEADARTALRAFIGQYGRLLASWRDMRACVRDERERVGDKVFEACP